MKVAIVEDNYSDAKLLQSFIDKFSEESKVQFEIMQFEDGMSFVTSYSPDYDIVFFDIEMPHLNGMDSAKEIRAIDPNVTIIFVTNMSQFAIEGYEVSAVGFMVKPVNYFAFQALMKKVVKSHVIPARQKIAIRENGTTVFLSSMDIFYVEATGHTLTFHTKTKEYSTNERLKNIASRLQESDFFMIKSCFLINLRYVSRVMQDSVIINGRELAISRRKKKVFLSALANYMGRGGE